MRYTPGMCNNSADTDAAWEQHERWRKRPARLGDLTPELRDRMAEAQNWRCPYCGERMDGGPGEPREPSFERIIPTKHGGADVPENVIIACRECNMRRGDRMSVDHITAIKSLSVHDRRRMMRPERLPSAA